MSSDKWIITTENLQGNPRYHVAEKNGVKAFAKVLRDNSGERLFVEIANELILSSLAKKLDIPMIDVFIDNLGTKGVCLFSVWAGDEKLNPTEPDIQNKISNYPKFKDLVVFDHWTYNFDRQDRHIVLDTKTDGKKFFTAIDNGHSLNDYNGQKLQSNSSLLLTPTQIYFDGGITSTLELKSMIEAIEKIDDKEIDQIVDNATIEISKWNPTEKEITLVKDNSQYIKQILKERKKNLRNIIEEWCKLKNKIIQWN